MEYPGLGVFEYWVVLSQMVLGQVTGYNQKTFPDKREKPFSITM
jgi:hypothetical protein